MQNQAQESEMQIQLEFKRLHDALFSQERQRLNALAAEEEQKITAIQELAKNTEQDIVGLRKLIESVKKGMGNEDVLLLQVRGSFSTIPEVIVSATFVIVIYRCHFYFRISRT